MIRLISILITITVLSLAVSWLAGEPGHVVVDWGVYHIETSLLVVLAAIAIGALACVIVYYVIFAVFRSPRSWLRSRLAKRQALGLEALTAAFAAIATQDKRAARKQIARAQQYLPHQPLTLMLASQVARLEGNESQSRLYLEQMLKAESTEFMALRGLIETARRSNDDDTALSHAEKALALKPNDPWLNVTLIGLYTKKQRTQDALAAINRAKRKGAIKGAEQRKLAAGVYYEQARSLISEKRYEQAIASLKEALSLQPDFVAASAQLGLAYASEGNTSAALVAVSKAWKKTPHPLLTEALLACLTDEKMRKKTVRTAEKLAVQHPENRESHFLIASVALKTGGEEVAHNELTHIIEERESLRACTLIAQAEQASGNAAEAATWLKRSHSALSDPGFACDNCHQPANDWHLTCHNCGHVDTLVWR